MNASNKTLFKNYICLLFLSFLGLFISCSSSEEISPPPPVIEIPEINYNIPVSDNDGWLVGDLGISEPKKTLLLDGADKIGRNIYGEIHSLLIVRDKKLIFEKYYSGRNSSGQFINFDRFTKHEVQSASKSFRSALIGIAIEKGFIEGVDSKLFSFFPEHEDLNIGNKDQIALDHVLTMSSGLEWNEWSGNSLSTMYSQPYNQWLPYVLGRPMEFNPGSTFVYNTGMSIGLNNVIVNSVPTSFSDFVRIYYSDLVESTNIPGVGNPVGASTTPRDMAKLGYIFLYDGKWKDEQIVSKGWIEKSITPRFNFGNGVSYGYQWWIRTLRYSNKNYNTFYANGNGGQFVIVIKDLDLVITSTGGKFGTAGEEIFTFIQEHVLPAFKSI